MFRRSLGLTAVVSMGLGACGGEPLVGDERTGEVRQALVNHRPTISWLGNLRATTSATPASQQQSFTVADDGSSTLTVAATSSNTTLLPSANIVLGGSGANRTISVTPAASTSGLATVTVTVSDGSKTSATSFTLTVSSASSATLPVIQSIANETIPVSTSYGPVTFAMTVVEDASGNFKNALTLTASSSNTTLVQNSKVVFGGQNYGRTVKVTPETGKTGRATITLSASDGTNTVSTSFVLDVVSNTAPAISALPLYQATTKGQAAADITFSLSDAETTALSDLRVTATSSNTALLPNSNLSISGSGANRTLSISGPSPTAGAATVTLAVSDGEIVRSASVLHVVVDPNAASATFARPRGIFVLDGAQGTAHTTPWGASTPLRDANIRDLPHVSGFALRVRWNEVESPTGPGEYDFAILENALAKLPAGQRLSLIVVDEPAYIADTSGVTTWQLEPQGTPGAKKRPVPWDPYLRERRRALLKAMAAHRIDGVPFAQQARLSVLNPYLPGGHTGLRDPQGKALHDMVGYSKEVLLATVQDELRTLQHEFPGKFVHLGFWPIQDWEYLQSELLEEFNGSTKPRVGFFMESLAASRSSAGVDPYSGIPVSAFGAPLVAARDATWNAFQMLGNWTRPFSNGHVANTVNGTPSDAIEYAYSPALYGAEYSEVYVNDIDNTSMQRGLEAWHDFFEEQNATIPTVQALWSSSSRAGDHGCVIVDDGSVKCWGSNSYGEQGVGDTVTRGDQPGEMAELDAVSLGKPAKTVALGVQFSCAHLADDTVKCWGRNDKGQLGIGSVTTQKVPPADAVKLGSDRTVKQLALGQRHACALLDNGTVKCWGDNALGQLGVGHASNQGDGPSEMGDSLDAVPLGQLAKSLALGSKHSCALLADDTLKCWGYGFYGQLGNGSTSNVGDLDGEVAALDPIELGPGSKAKLVAAGGDHTCAVLVDDSIKCWGASYGYGDGESRGNGPKRNGRQPPHDRSRSRAYRQVGRYRQLAHLCAARRQYGQVLGRQRVRPAGPGRHAAARRRSQRNGRFAPARAAGHRPSRAQRRYRDRQHLCVARRSFGEMLGSQRQWPAWPR